MANVATVEGGAGSFNLSGSGYTFTGSSVNTVGVIAINGTITFTGGFTFTQNGYSGTINSGSFTISGTIMSSTYTLSLSGSAAITVDGKSYAITEIDIVKTGSTYVGTVTMDGISYSSVALQ
jgi:hypothetical protein